MIGSACQVRMSMEIIFVFAAITGRTLVLPPKEPLYRLSVSIWGPAELVSFENEMRNTHRRNIYILCIWFCSCRPTQKTNLEVLQTSSHCIAKNSRNE